jgi:hypothetical protein
VGFTSTLSTGCRGLDIVAAEKNCDRKTRLRGWPFITVHETSHLELGSEVNIMTNESKVFPPHAMRVYGC